MKRSITGKLILAVLAISLISLVCVGTMHAKYATVDDTHNVSFDMLARYKVSFDTDGGVLDEADENKIVERGQIYGTLPTPTKEKHKFLGWSPVLVNHSLGFLEVDYICNDSGQEYIDTGIIPQKSYEYGITFSIANDLSI